MFSGEKYIDITFFGYFFGATGFWLKECKNFSRESRGPKSFKIFGLGPINKCGNSKPNRKGSGSTICSLDVEWLTSFRIFQPNLTNRLFFLTSITTFSCFCDKIITNGQVHFFWDTLMYLNYPDVPELSWFTHFILSYWNLLYLNLYYLLPCSIFSLIFTLSSNY